MAEIKSTAKKLEPGKVELEIEVPPEEIKAQIDQAIKEMGKTARVPGFRKGKIPRPVLVSHFGKEAIMARTLHDALPLWYEEAIEQAEIKPIDNPELDFDTLDDQDKPYSFKAAVPVVPRPRLGKYIGLEAEKEVVEVKGAEVEEPIERMRKRVARLEEVTDRPAGNGDFVVIDFTGFVDEEALEGGSGKDYMLELGSGTFIPGFEDQIAGMEEGQSKKLTLTFPEDYRPENLAGKEVVFDVTAKEIKERVLPGLTDEFVSENSEFDTLEELRGDIRSRMTKAREAAAENLFREQVLEKAVEAAEFDIPEVMLEKRSRELEEEFAMALKDSGLTIEAYAERAGMPAEELRNGFRSEAERQIKQDLVLETVARNEGLQVGADEVEAEIRDQAVRRGIDAEKLLEKTRKARREGFVKENLLRRKALDLLAEKAIPVLHKHTAAVKEEEKPEIIKP